MTGSRGTAGVLMLLAVSACNSDTATAPPTAANTAPSTAATPAAELESHPIQLTSRAGTQDAALAPCVRFKEGSAPNPPVCADYVPALRPSSLSVVRPGEKLTISFPGAQVENPSGCAQICGATGTLQPLGCEDRPLDGFQLLDASSITWQPDLPPGRYELDVYANLRTDDGRKVFATGDLGLIVDADRKLEILPADLPPCPESG